MESKRSATHQLLKRNLERAKTPILGASDPISLYGISRNRRSNSQIPTAEDIKRFSSTFLASKKRSPEVSPEPIRIHTQRNIKLPRLQLQKALKGVNTGSNWFKDEESLELHENSKITRFSSKPKEFSNRKLFPSADIATNDFPKSLTERFGQINPSQDPELANYLVNPKNAFKAHWSKHRSLKDRKFYPNTHPEFHYSGIENNKKTDHVVVFREAMLLCKNMMKEAWSVKK